MSEFEYKYLAKRHLKSIILIFISSVGIACFFVETSIQTRGFISEVFVVAASLLFMNSLFFSALIYSWFKFYKEGLATLETTTDNEYMLSVYRDVLGPIPWHR